MQGPTPAERPALEALVEQQEKALRKALITQRTPTFAVHAIQRVHERVDALAAQVRRQPGAGVACQAGCSHCCHLRVEAMAPEVFLLARQVHRWPEAERQALQARLDTHAARAEGLQMHQHRLRCPLLGDDNRCSAYAERPFMCRKLMSSSVAACAHPAQGAVEDRTMFLQAAAITYGAHKGYGRAKLPNAVHELGQALRLALADPGAEARWFRGEDVFAPLPDEG